MYGWRKMYTGMGVLIMYENKQRDLIYLEKKSNMWEAKIHYGSGGYKTIGNDKDKSTTINMLQNYMKHHPNE